MTLDLGYQVTTSGTAPLSTNGPVAAVNTSPTSGSAVNTRLNNAATTIGSAVSGAVNRMDNLTPNYTYTWAQPATATLTPVNVGGINVLDITGNGGGAIGNITLNGSGETQWIRLILML
jgi:hypothetical protein